METVNELRNLASESPQFVRIVCALLLLTLAFPSCFAFFLLFWAFLGGAALTYTVLRTTSEIPNLCPIFSPRSATSKVTAPRDSEGHGVTSPVCGVCDKEQCTRHRQLSLKTLQPWADLNIPQKVDSALEKLLNLVLDVYVYSWYRKKLSTVEDFPDELRYIIRFALATILRRAGNIDITSLVNDKLIKHALRHLDLFIQVHKTGVPMCEISARTVQYLGGDLHCAVSNRRTEIRYLGHLVQRLFPHIMPAKALQSQGACSLLREIVSRKILLLAMDVVSDPDSINSLLLVFFDKEPIAVSNDPPSPDVPFLAHFAARRADNFKACHIELSEILSDQQMLHSFLHFMKSEGSLNILQFCLTVEDFNRRSLVPDLSDHQTGELHREARQIYQTYCAPTAPDRIQFDEDIIEELKQIADGPCETVTRLRTQSTLFKAYENAYNLLENTYCPLFHQSYDYFRMVCEVHKGALSNRQQSASQSVKSKNDSGAVSKFGTRIKGVFRGSQGDVRFPSSDPQSDTVVSPTSNSFEYASDSDSDLDDDDDDDVITHSPIIDLTDYQVTIPRIDVRYDPVTGKKYFMYIVCLDKTRSRHSSGHSPPRIEVARRFHEFYVLESKLTEFHGDFEDFELPPKRSLLSKTFDYYESKRPSFQKFLQSLMKQPVLQGSQLVFNFVSTEQEFEDKFLPEVNISKIIKSVPTKLRIEKGQYLVPFLQSFLASVEAAKPRPSKSGERERAERVSVENDLYGNLAGRAGVEHGPRRASVVDGLSNMYDYIVYAAKNVYEVSDWLFQLLVSARIILKNTVDALYLSYLTSKIDLLKSDFQMENIILLLTDVLFFDEDPPRTEAHKRIRAEETLNLLNNFMPGFLVYVLGEHNHNNGNALVMSCLQQPVLNKHLIYTLLDIIILELFPELDVPKL